LLTPSASAISCHDQPLEAGVADLERLERLGQPVEGRRPRAGPTAGSALLALLAWAATVVGGLLFHAVNLR
jgi:hypothetical protein